MKRLIRVFIASLYIGCKSLASPQGFLTLLALLVSIAAYLRSSVTITDVYLVFDKAPTWILKERLRPDDTWEVTGQRFEPFALVVASAGTRSIYVNNLRMNLVVPIDGANFDDECTYVNWESDGSSTYEAPYVFSLRSTSSAYEFNVKDGFFVAADSAVSFEGTLVDPLSAMGQDRRSASGLSDELIEEYTLNRVTRLFDAQLQLDVCLTGMIVASGSAPERFRWTSSSHDFFSLGAFAVTSPEGNSSELLQERGLIVNSPLFSGREPIIRKWAFNLF